jgi:hypothetical protein
MMSKHTPGPWYHTGLEFNDVRDSDDELVAVAHHLRVGQPKRSGQEAKANARLIATAPDLLAVLQELIDIEGPQPGTAAWADKARAAIAKATGENNDQN